jgi:hypothetical protein
MGISGQDITEPRGHGFSGRYAAAQAFFAGRRKHEAAPVLSLQIPNLQFHPDSLPFFAGQVRSSGKQAARPIHIRFSRPASFSSSTI